VEGVAWYRGEKRRREEKRERGMKLGENSTRRAP
jgi:hypothetical protein